MAKILAKCRKLVTLFQTSTSVNDVLGHKQKLLLPEKVQGHKLIADVVTRWNSTLDMLSRILEQHPALMAVASDESVSKTARTIIQNSLLTFDETSIAEQVVEVMQPFKLSTKIVCSEANPTINKVLPIVTKLMRGLEISESDSNTVKTLKLKMREQMNYRTSAEDLALLGSILNPYTKEFQHNPCDKSKAKELLLGKVKAKYAENPDVVKKEPVDALTPDLPKMPNLPVPPDDNEADVELTPTATQIDVNRSPKKQNSFKSADTDDWLMDVMCVGESMKSSTELIEDEVSRYLSVVIKESDGNLTVLEWWRKKEIFFPRLATIAKQLLCVQASSVPSERVFSLSGALVSKKRARMSAENVDMFVLLYKNIARFW